MNVIAIEQLTSLALLIIFLSGITCGVISAAVLGSRRGALLVPAADDLLGAGARVIYGVYTRDDDGYLQSLLTRGGRASGDQRGDEGAELVREPHRDGFIHVGRGRVLEALAHGFARGGDQPLEQSFLAGKVPVEGHFGDAPFSRDPVERRPA